MIKVTKPWDRWTGGQVDRQVMGSSFTGRHNYQLKVNKMLSLISLSLSDVLSL